MRNKAVSTSLCCLFTLILCLGFFRMNAEGAGYTVGEVEDLAGGIVGYELDSTGSGSIQDWINGSLTENAGISSEWFILGLSQSGERSFSSYEKALRAYLSTKTGLSATSQEKYALAFIAAGSSDSYITEALENSAGKQGIMSWIYALHIMNNGYTAPGFTADGAVRKLLSMQYKDGGWALFGKNGDIDVTAMTLQALAPYYSTDADVRQAADRALAFLSERQQENGGYSSFGTQNPESAAQVLTALSALGIDCQKDERFIKNGCNIIDAMLSYRLPDGSYCHTAGGASNTTATVQAYYSYVAYIRLLRRQSPLLVLDNRKPQEVTVTTAVTTTVTTTAASSDAQSQTNVTNTTAAVQSASASQTTAETVTTTVTSVTSAPAMTTSSLTSSQPAQTTETSLSAAAPTTSTISAAAGTTDDSHGGYKGKAIAVTVGAASVLSLITFAAGKRNYKNFIAIGAVSAGAAVFILVTDFQSTDNYYTGEKKHKANAIGTVTMTIRCDTVADRLNSEFIPDDGIILDVTEFDIEEGETAYDILIEAARAYHIQVENKGSAGSAHGMVYIAGINYLYEMDFGDLSGWVYHVNGITPSRGCGEYVLSDGDRIEWLYTCELGHDLNEVYEQ